MSQDIDFLKNGNKTILHDPTYENVTRFLLEDKTNEDYPIVYYCIHFSRDVNNNAEEQGFRCAYVEVNLDIGVPHALVAFNTFDQGLVFFEPQTDEIVILEIGKDYWEECAASGVSHGPGFIVQDYTIYW